MIENYAVKVGLYIKITPSLLSNKFQIKSMKYYIKHVAKNHVKSCVSLPKNM